jgi:gluconokinase
MNEARKVDEAQPRWVVMGVSGCGKSSVGIALAAALGVRFVEGDQYHSAENVAKMAAGTPLTDDDRAQWLASLQAEIRASVDAGVGIVVSCSALKRRYRDVLRAGAPNLRFAYLAGSKDLIAGRMATRTGHYMPLSLLDSQLAALEPLEDDEAGVRLDICETVPALVEQVLAR